MKAPRALVAASELRLQAKWSPENFSEVPQKKVTEKLDSMAGDEPIPIYHPESEPRHEFVHTATNESRPSAIGVP